MKKDVRVDTEHPLLHSLLLQMSHSHSRRFGILFVDRANDPLVMRVERDSNTNGGFLGLANNKVKTIEQYTMDGSIHTRPSTSTTIADGKSEACIKAIGGAENTGRLVGSSVGASVAPSVANIPIIGWVAAGWVTMFSGNQGAEIGGQMAEDLNKDC